MANADAAFGLRPIGGMDGSPYNGGTIKCVIASGDGTATFIGDPVKLAGSAVLAQDGGVYPTVVQGTADAEYFGVVTSFEADPADLTAQYRKASTERMCNVVPALDTLFVCQTDGTMDLDDVGLTTDFVNSLNVLTAGSTVTGLSGVELDETPTTGANVIMLGVYNSPDNVLDGTESNTMVIVRLNESSLRGDGSSV